MMKKRDERGYTLIELLVVMIIMSIVAIMLVGFITTWLQQLSLSQDRTALLNDAQNAVTTITTDIQLSGDVDVKNTLPDPYGPGGNQYGWASDNNTTLVLAKIAINSSDNVIFSDAPTDTHTQKDNEIYYLSGSTLYRRTLASAGSSAVTTCPPADATPSCPADKTVATGVASNGLTFTYYDVTNTVSNVAQARSVQVAMTLSKVLDSQTISATYTTRMVFRNNE